MDAKTDLDEIQKIIVRAKEADKFPWPLLDSLVAYIGKEHTLLQEFVDANQEILGLIQDAEGEITDASTMSYFPHAFAARRRGKLLDDIMGTLVSPNRLREALTDDL